MCAPPAADGLARVASAAVSHATDDILSVLTSPERRTRMVETNFAAGREPFSLDALERILRGLLSPLGLG